VNIALFDLDGTITRHDTLTPYIFGFCLRRPHRLAGFLAMPLPLLRFLFNRDRGRLKQALIRATLRGVTRRQIADWNTRWVPRLLRRATQPEALRQIQTHRQAGDYLILMSASVDLYVPAIARALGFNETICTGVRWNGLHLEGELTTPNRRDEDKRLCIQTLRQRHPDAHLTAYGNSASDLPHFQDCNSAYLVNASGRAIRKAAASHINIGWPTSRPSAS
jgi:HAD superfamily hydrolase (TIGR01490 family)